MNRAAERLYLRLLRRCLVRDIFHDQRYDGDVTRPLPYSAALRFEGRDWPTDAETMVGWTRLENLEDCCVMALQDGVPGDFVETGVWRGGCSILMRAVQKAFGAENRAAWLFDSFEGLPKPDSATYPHDEGDINWTVNPYLGVSLEQVKKNFQRYEVLDDRVRFVQGWFRDTIPVADVDSIAVLRMDGDMYESTWLVLNHLYPKLSPGGFAIVDDYGALHNCKAAVDDFRAKNSIDSPITKVDWTGVFWRK